MIKVTRQREEYREHVFELPDGMDPDSDEAQEIYDDFNWRDATCYHADDNTVSVVDEGTSDE